MKKFKVKIGVDFDDVIVDCHSLKPILVNAMFDVDVPLETFSKDFLIENNLLSAEEYLQMGRKLFSEDHPMLPIDSSLETIGKFVSEGHDVAIVSSRSEEDGTLKPAINWMKKYNLDVPITGVGYKNSKRDTLKGFDVFIDDDPDNLISLVGVVPHLLLFSSLQNKNQEVPVGAIRVSSWDEVYKYINNNFK